MRIAIEAIMDWCRIPKTSVNPTKPKRVKLTLHARIERFRKENPDLGEKLLAIKWLGNVGSHRGRISKKNVYDGYVLLRYVIEEMFERRKKNLDRLARRIIRKKGPA